MAIGVKGSPEFTQQQGFAVGYRHLGHCSHYGAAAATGTKGGTFFHMAGFAIVIMTDMCRQRWVSARVAAIRTGDGHERQ